MTTTEIEIVKPEVEKQTQLAVAGALSFRVVDAATYNFAGEELTKLKGAQKRVDAVFDPIIAKAYEAHKEAVKQKKVVSAPIAAAEAHYKGQMIAWKREEDAKRIKAQAAAQAAALKQEEDRRLNAAVVLETQGRTAEADRMLAAPISAPPVIAESNVPKVPGISPRTTYRAEVVDFPALVAAVASGSVPIEAIQPNEKFLRQQASSMKKALAYPGVQVVEDENISARSS